MSIDSSHLCSTAVLVRICGPDPKTLKVKHRSFFILEAGKTTLSCSGFVAKSNSVVTSAWLIAPFLKESTDPDVLIQGTRLEVCGDDGVVRQARLRGIWRCPERVKQIMRELSGEEELANIRGTCHGDVAILDCDTTGLSPVSLVSDMERGDSVCVVSSAFGLVSPTVFRNSVTRGILSNITEGSLCLTDARCLAGAEGAPVFDSANGLVGMVLPQLMRRDGLPLELAMLLPCHLFWRDTVNTQLDSSRVTRRIEMASVNASMRIAQGAAQRVALIRVGVTWGSGVLVYRGENGDGVLVTCAHVVKAALENFTTIHVSFRGIDRSIERNAQLLFCSEGPVDIAFVHIMHVPDTIAPINLGASMHSGDSVYAIGYALFEPHGAFGKQPTICQGNLSKVVTLNEKATLLQTCAQVYRGHSGGLICNTLGQIMGVITSNARHSDGSIIPEINFAIPISFFKHIVDAFDETSMQDGSLNLHMLGEIFQEFEQATKADETLKMLWALQPVGDNQNTTEPPDNRGSGFHAFFNRFLQSKL